MKIGLDEQESDADGEACNLSCLVAIGRVQAPVVASASTSQRLKLRTIEFVSKHAIDGKFLFVDQRWVGIQFLLLSIDLFFFSSFFLRSATQVLGFLPQELIGTSMYEYYHPSDIPHLAESYKAALQSSERVTTQVCITSILSV